MSHPTSTWPLISDPTPVPSALTGEGAFESGEDIQLDVDDDIVLVSDLVLTPEGPESVEQALLIALRMVRGEWFADLDEGLPLLEGNGVEPEEALLGQPYEEDKWRREISAIIEGVKGVTELVRLDIANTAVNRTVKVRAQVQTSDGLLEIETEVG